MFIRAKDVPAQEIQAPRANSLDSFSRPICIYCLNAIGAIRLSKYEGLVCLKCSHRVASCEHLERTVKYVRLTNVDNRGTHLVIFAQCKRCSLAVPVFGLSDDGPMYDYEPRIGYFGIPPV